MQAMYFPYVHQSRILRLVGQVVLVFKLSGSNILIRINIYIGGVSNKTKKKEKQKQEGEVHKEDISVAWSNGGAQTGARLTPGKNKSRMKKERKRREDAEKIAIGIQVGGFVRVLEGVDTHSALAVNSILYNQCGGTAAGCRNT